MTPNSQEFNRFPVWMPILTLGLYLLVFICPLQLRAQPVFESFVTNKGKTAAATVNKPSGVVANDLLVVGLTFEKGSNETISPPAGWTLIRRTDNSTDNGMATYYKVAGVSEPSSYTFTLTNGSKWCIGISRISNVRIIAPIDVSAGSTNNGSSITAPTITTTDANRLVLCFYSSDKAATFTPNASTTERYDAPNTEEGNPANMMATFVQATAGATGNIIATASQGGKGSGQQVAITPASQPPLVPIELIEFDATVCRQSSVCLSWQTASETDNEWFAIERSVNGIQWEVVIKIKGAGNSTVLNRYSAVDPAPNFGTNLYRLKQTDFSGLFSYSQIRSVNVEKESDPQIKVFPNPSSDLITIEGNSNEFCIYNLLGERITSGKCQAGSSFVLDISNLAPGIYYLKMGNNTIKVYKQ